MLISDPEKFMSHEPFHEFDLIVVDYNLEGYGHGEDFIKQIRDHDVFTEVIFYSANPASELWNAVRDKMLEEVAVGDPQPSLVWSIGGILILAALIATFWM